MVDFKKEYKEIAGGPLEYNWDNNGNIIITAEDCKSYKVILPFTVFMGPMGVNNAIDVCKRFKERRIKNG